MDAAQILSTEKYGDLFPCGEDRIRAAYRALAMEWHPDRCPHPGAAQVFVKIDRLYHEALAASKEGRWEKTGYILLDTSDGGRIGIAYDACLCFELGTCYVARTKVIYLTDSDRQEYHENAIRRILGLRYQDRRMEAHLSGCVPRIVHTFRTRCGRHGIVMEKGEDVYPLRTVCGHFAGRMDPRHVAWIMSRLCNLACFLEYNGLVHNGICLDTCFISPERHAVLLLGGWWYATKADERMLGTTREIYSVMPVRAKSTKRSSPVTDIESVKLLGRQLLGGGDCRRLASDPSVPGPFKDFLTDGSGSDAYGMFVRWDRALAVSYGKRKFIRMEFPGASSLRSGSWDVTGRYL